MRTKPIFNRGCNKTFKSTKPTTPYMPTTELVLQQPVIPFERPKSPNYKKDEVFTFKLQTDLDNNTLPTYEISIPYFREGTAECLFTILCYLEEVIARQNANDPASKYALMHCLLQGDALACFNQSALKHVEESNENFYLCGNNLIMHVLPVCALSEQKRYMR